MYNTLYNWMANKAFTLADAEARISWTVANGKITTVQADELLAYANTHATGKTLDDRIIDIGAPATATDERIGTVEAGVTAVTAATDELVLALADIIGGTM